MKIKQKQAIDAYREVRKLETQDMDGSQAIMLFALREALEPQFRFQDEQEHKYSMMLNCPIRPDGTISFPDAETRRKYLDKIDELSEIEVELNWELKRFNINGIRISMNGIEALRSVLEVVCE